MKRKQVLAVALLAAVALLISVVASSAQQKPPGKDIVRYDGRVKILNKETKTLTLQSKTGAVQIKYTDKTQLTYRNKPASLNDLREGRRVIVILDPKEKEMVATRIDLRE